MAWTASVSCYASGETQKTSVGRLLSDANISLPTLTEFPVERKLQNKDWRVVMPLLFRLRQLVPSELGRLAEAKPMVFGEEGQELVGELVGVRGRAEKAERIALPVEMAESYELPALFRCSVRLDGTGRSVMVMTANIPRAWHGRDRLSEPVGADGVLLRILPKGQTHAALLLTDRLAWYPVSNVPTGQLLLANAGVDVALLDDVAHGRDFIRPDQGREADAFYACLDALGRLDRTRIAAETKKNVVQIARQWKARQPHLREDHRQLKAQWKESNKDQRKQLQLKIDRARKLRGIAAVVVSRSEQGQSSVAPLFLQPEKEVGQLVRITGTARRAVRIATPDRSERDEYFEIEVFTTDSQNLPVVGCVGHLPKGFPMGDKIRESVRLDGIFFKSWRYRSRRAAAEVDNARGQEVSVPVVLGHAPEWISSQLPSGNRWGLYGGVAFLALLVVGSVSIARAARRDRLVRKESRLPERLDF